VRPAFLITIDTEGDNLWAGPRQLTTRNSHYLPRFQALCERFGLKPTYLTDYEMALCPVFAKFAADACRRNAAEIGAHLHPWNTPPLRPLTEDDDRYMPYATEYPPGLIAEKLAVLTDLLVSRFSAGMTSHRAGRWGFDGRYARVLAEAGYLVDCSVTPGISWKLSPGRPGGAGGPDYTSAPRDAYFLDFDDIRRPGSSTLLEAPVTIMAAAPKLVERLRQSLPQRAYLRRALSRIYPPLVWLRPNGKNLRQMLAALAMAVQEERSHVEFMLHSSELMPGGSPYFPDAESIEALYRDLDVLFAAAARACRPCTLTGFARQWHPAGSPVVSGELRDSRLQ
jgi:hypothetical protein